MWSVSCPVLSNRTVNTSIIICFLWSPCQRCIGDCEGLLQSVIAEKPRVKDTKPSWKRVLEGSAAESTRARMERVLSELWTLSIDDDRGVQSDWRRNNKTSLWFEALLPALRSVARRRLVKTENPSARGTVNCKVCKSAIALYFLYLRVFVKEGVFFFFFYLVGWDLTPIRSLCRSPRFV
jgi:hypothetical protein